MCITLQILYVDADTLWLDDPRGWWDHFKAMDAQGALFGMSEESRSGGWYSTAGPEGARLQLRC